MKPIKNANFLALTFLLSCSSVHQKVATETQSYKTGGRSIAEADAINGVLSSQNIGLNLKGIFHSYLLGQVLLNDFDKSLEKNPKTAMESSTYAELLAVRTMVDEFEENIDDYYVKLVMVSALPKSSEEQKKAARETLGDIGSFMEGISTDKKEIPENLKHMILGNLREKQTHLYDELIAIQDDPSVTNNDPQVIATIQENLVKLRGTRMKYFKAQKEYVVDQNALNTTMAELKNDSDFKTYRASVKKLSKEIRKITKELQKDRSTSGASIFPSAGKAGNVSGRNYPANTWSMTYDDGPGGKTTPTVLENLKNREVKATFFMLARQVEALPLTAKSVVDAGMDIGCHSYDHAQLTKVGPAELEWQIGGAKKIIEGKLDRKMKLYRLPYGAGVGVASIRAKIAEHNMIHVYWSVDTLDWQDKNPASIVVRAKKQMAAFANNSGVILFHDIHPQSVIASAALMDDMKKKKVNFCTVQEVIDQMNEGRNTCH